MTKRAAMEDYAKKPAGYYSSVRQDILVHVPLGPNRVLDVGCGEGLMARALKQEGKASWVAGVELLPEAAADAKGGVDELVVGGVAQVEHPFERQSFYVVRPRHSPQ